MERGGFPPSDGDVAVSLCLLVRLGRAIVFAFPLVSYPRCLGDIIVRAVRGLMILLIIHSMTIEGWAHMSRFRRAELSMKDGGRYAHRQVTEHTAKTFLVTVTLPVLHTSLTLITVRYFRTLILIPGSRDGRGIVSHGQV